MYIFLYIVLLLLLAYGILIDYYRRSWNSIPLFDVSSSQMAATDTKVTVIIPARNEEKNIADCLQSVLKQNYPITLLQIIVVNDHSTDNTEAIVKRFNHPSIILINLADHIEDRSLLAYKKKAIEIAVAQSSGELILTTDADCVVPENWVRYMAGLYAQHHAAFIAAPVKIMNHPSVLSAFQCLDFITLQGITGAVVYKKMHMMCNGANLGYEKKAFHAVEGFKGIDSIASGDDMLMMYKIYKKFPENIYFLKNKNAIVCTGPATDWRSFFNQRTRWASKADKYDDKKIFRALFFVYLLNASILLFFIAGFWDVKWFVFFIVLLIIKTVIEFRFVYTVAGFFDQKKLMRYFFFLQPLHVLYIVVTGASGKFAGYEWKGRKVK